MSLPGNINQLLIGASASGGDVVGPIKSVRFNNDDSAYLERTPSSSGNRRLFTYSTWVKRSDLSSATNYCMLSVGVSNYNIFQFRSNGKIRIEGNSPSMDINTNALFRDASAWYHVVLTVDTSQATAADRVKIYVNNVLQTDDGTAAYPAINSDFEFNTLNPHAIGRYATSRYFDGYMTSTVFVDGQALDPSSFGEYDANQVWQVKDVTGLTFGTNGFHLFDFENESGIGDDSSGNDNDWTPYNFNTSSGTFPTPPASGGVYSNNYIGYYLNGNPPIFLVYDPSGTNRGDSVSHGGATGTTWVVDDVLQWAIDWSAGKIWLGRNNTWYASGDPAGGTNPAASSFDTSYNYYLELGYDSSDFELQVPASPSYTPPSGFTYWGGATISTWRNSGTNQGGVVDAFKTAIPKSGKTYIEAIIKGGFTLYATLGLANFGEDTVTTDVLFDVPTNKNQSDTGVGGEVSGNYACWNPLFGENQLIEDGNLTAKCSSAGNYAIIASTLAMTSGKYYMEYTYNKNSGNFITFGVSQTNRDGKEGSGVTDTPEDFGFKCWDAGFYSQTNGTNQHNYSSSISDGDVLSLAFDADDGKLWVAKNGTWMTNASGTGDPANGNNPDFSSLTYSGGYFFMAGPYVDGTTNILIGNFGQSSWTYAAPSGFKALCTTNQSTPSIVKGSTAQSTDIWSGNSSTRTISGLDFGPEWVWIKTRNQNSINSIEYDYMRGPGYYLYPTDTNTENYNAANGLTAFNSDGYDLYDPGGWSVNTSGHTYVGYSWDAGTPPTRTHTQPAYYSSTTLYTTAADVVANATPRSAGDAISSEYIYIVTNSGGRIGQKLFDTTGSLPSTWYLLMYQNSAWESYGSYNNSTDVPLFKWRQVFDNTFNTYTIANDVELNIISNGTSPALVSATLPTLFTTTDDGAVVNTDGDITSRVRANPSVGFSIVMWTSIPWTGSAVNRQVGHGLGAAPAFIITKGTENAASWYCYHKDIIDSNPQDYYVTLNGNSARGNLADSWGPNQPDTTTFGDRLLGFSDNQTAIAYVFTPVKGFSDFGSYVGTGTDDGAFVFTGFQVKYLLTRAVSAGSDWQVWDTTREPENPNANTWAPNTTGQESGTGGYKVDLLSNGFKFRMYGSSSNAAGVTYIWAAFAAHPTQLNGGLAR